MSKLPLTAREQKILKYIQDYVAENEYSPTSFEVANYIGSPNHQAGLYFINQLVTKGHLKKEKGHWRNIIINN